MANNRLGGSKLAFIAVLLAVVLVVLAYVFLAGEPESPETTAVSAPAQQQEQSTAAEAPPPQSATRAENKSPKATLEEPEADWTATTRGDTRYFSLFHGEIGYVDVASILRNRNPYSILALLQSHQELTGAGDFLEIEIIYTPSENEIWGYQAYFRQLIDGEPTNEVGSVLFSADGAVGGLSGRLVNPERLSAADLLILQPEAETIAREAAIRYAASLSDMSPSDTDLTTEILSATLDYQSDSENNLRRVWTISVSIDSPKWDALNTPGVHISPETGEVIAVLSGAIHEAAPKKSPCDTISFNMCNAAGTEENSCSGNTLPLKPAHYAAKKYAENVITSVSAASSTHIQRPAGFNCEIDIIMDQKPDGNKGTYFPSSDKITISKNTHSRDYEKVVTHEVFHALTRTPKDKKTTQASRDVEHGLVYAMTALELGGDDWESSAYDNFAEHPDAVRKRGHEPEPYHAHVHTFYKIFKKDGVGKDRAFQLVLGVDLRTPQDEAALQKAISDIANGLGIGPQVAEVLKELSANTTDTESVPTLSDVLKEAQKKFSNGDYAGNRDPVGEALRVEYSRVKKMMEKGNYGAADKAKFEKLLKDVSTVMGLHYLALNMQYEDEPSRPHRPGQWPDWPSFPGFPGGD